MKTHFCLLVFAMASAATGFSQSGVDEPAIRLEPSVERVSIHQVALRPSFVRVSRFETKLEESARGVESIQRLRFEIVPMNVGEAVSGNTVSGAEVYGFTHGHVISISETNIFLVASDMEGASPFEHPDNLMVRLWLVPASLRSLSKESPVVSMDQVKTAYFEDRKTASVSRLFFGGDLFSSIEQLSVAMCHADSGICVGRTEGSGIWAKEFSLKPLGWRKDGGVLKGHFTKHAVAMFNGKLFIAAVGKSGELTVYSTESAGSLAKAQSAKIILPPRIGALKCIALTSSGNGVFLGVLTDAGDKDEVLIYRYSASEMKWDMLIGFALGRKGTNLSMLSSEDGILYSYICISGENAELFHGNIPWSAVKQ
jgi:hypothetical protein